MSPVVKVRVVYVGCVGCVSEITRGAGEFLAVVGFVIAQYSPRCGLYHFRENYRQPHALLQYTHK
jgi:hypothetical protein